MKEKCDEPGRDNIILIGMPGAGKSTLGIVLAKIMNYDFVDADLLIQQQSDKTLERIIDALGPEGFIQVENQVLTQIEYEELKGRLSDLSERGVVMKGGIGMSLRDLFDERKPLYEKYADITVDVNDLSITAAARKVADALR